MMTSLQFEGESDIYAFRIRHGQLLHRIAKFQLFLKIVQPDLATDSGWIGTSFHLARQGDALPDRPGMNAAHLQSLPCFPGEFIQPALLKLPAVFPKALVNKFTHGVCCAFVQ